MWFVGKMIKSEILYAYALSEMLSSEKWLSKKVLSEKSRGNKFRGEIELQVFNNDRLRINRLLEYLFNNKKDVRMFSSRLLM